MTPSQMGLIRFKSIFQATVFFAFLGSGCIQDDKGGQSVMPVAGSPSQNSGSMSDGNMDTSQTQSPVTNPSGSCVVDHNGAHPGYSVPGPGDVYLPDCQLALKRSLWRVFVQPDGKAYVIPRPDALGLSFGFCDPDDPLKAIFESNGLCAEVGNPSVLNAMTPKDALTITSALHARLRFRSTQNGDQYAIEPFAPPADIYAACSILTDVQKPAADAACTHAERQLGDGPVPSIGIIYTQEQTELLADALNQIYGIGH